MKNVSKVKKLSEDMRERGRLEYLLGRRELELESLKGELNGEREVNSLCAAFIMYLLLQNSESRNEGGVLQSEVNKAEVNELVGKYFAACEDGGDVYRVIFTERSSTSDDEVVYSESASIEGELCEA